MRILSALAIAIAVFLSWSSAQATQIRSSLDSNLCLSGEKSPPVMSGNSVIVAKCDATAREQQWTIAIMGSELILTADVQDQGRALCADVSGGVIADNTNVQFFGCNQSAAQIWQPGGGIVDSSTGQITGLKFQLKANPDFCMDISGGVKAPGTNVQLFKCNNTGSQYWQSN